MIETPIISPIGDFLQRVTLRLFADWKVLGAEYVPQSGPLIIVANHQSNFDSPLLSASIPRRMGFLAKQEIFSNPIANWFLRSYGSFPINRAGTDARAYRWVLEQLEGGHAVGFFPEGTRSTRGMRKALPGIAQIALRSEAPILPVGISGTARLVKLTRVFNPTGTIRVNIGPIFTVPTIEGKPSRESLDSIAEMIMLRVASLLPEELRGVYNRKRVDSPQTDQSAARH